MFHILTVGLSSLIIGTEVTAVILHLTHFYHDNILLLLFSFRSLPDAIAVVLSVFKCHPNTKILSRIFHTSLLKTSAVFICHTYLLCLLCFLFITAQSVHCQKSTDC